MKAMDIIDRVDMLEPNGYSPEQKLLWLSILDGKVYNEVLKTHEGCQIDSPPKYITGTEELLIPAPYGEEIYYYYLQAMIAAEIQETARYTNRKTQYTTAYREWANMYNRSHAPLKTARQFV